MRALIVEEGLSRGALAAVRGLGRDGWVVGIGSPRPGGLAASSRWARRWHRVTAPGDGLSEFLATTRLAVREGRYEVVLGAGDAEVLALSMGREEIGASVPCAPHENVLRAFDKLELAAAAETAGIRTPRIVPATQENVSGIAGTVVVKARTHWHPGSSGVPARIEAAVVPSHEIARAVERIRARGGEPVLQDVVEGRLEAYVSLRNEEGEIVAEMQQRAGRLWPVPAGISVRAETIPIDRGLAERTQALLEHLGWFGLSEAQFLIPETGDPYLIDLNGRIYGSLALALAAGVNMPSLLARLATGRAVRRGAPAMEGIRYQWLEGDLRRAMVERRGGLLRDVLGSLAFAPTAVHSVWLAADPVPALRYGSHLLRRAGGRAARRASA